MSLKLCMIYTDWTHRPNKKYGGVGYYRIMKPAKFLKPFYDIDIFGDGLRVLGDTTESMWTRVFTGYDAIVIKHSDNEQAVGAMLFFANHYGKPIILDLDDNLIEIRPDQPGYKTYYPGSQKRAIVEAFISLVDGLIVSTQPLADFYKKRIKEVYGKDIDPIVCPNCSDTEDWPMPSPVRRNVIGYAGSTTHNSDLALVLPSMAKLMKEHKDWRFEILGAVEKTDVDSLLKDFDAETKERVEVKFGTQSWRGYPELLASQGWNVGLAPLINDEFNRGKSHIKWMEYSLAGIATLASRTYPYSEPIQGVDVVKDGLTGSLFDGAEDFEKKLCVLLENDKIRDELVANAKKAISTDWTYENHIAKWRQAIEKICSSRTPQTKQG